MTSTLEKAALAIYREAWGASADQRWRDDVRGRRHFMRLARAAVSAIRAPGEAEGDEPFGATIDAILSETV